MSSVFCHVTDGLSGRPMEVWGIWGWDGVRKSGGPIRRFKIDAKAARKLADQPALDLRLDTWLP